MSNLNIRLMDAAASGFATAFNELLDRTQSENTDVTAVVRDIVRAVHEQGDQALLSYTQRFDKLSVDSASALEGLT